MLTILVVFLLTTMASGESNTQMLARAMENFYKNHVDYDVALMNENKKIAESYVQELKEVLAENVRDLPLSIGGIEKQEEERMDWSHFPNVKYIEIINCQGSAYEGLKVGAPEEFDFAVQYRINKKSGNFVYIEGRTLGAKLDDNKKAAGYYKLELQAGGDKEMVDKWTIFTEEWPGGGRPCLSPRKVVQRVQSTIDKFLRSFLVADMQRLSVGAGAAATSQPFWRTQIVGVKRKPKGNPALTVSLQKKDGSIIDVDVSPCIVDPEQRHFVPKRHPILKGRPVDPNNPFELLWMRTESQKELKRINSIDQDGGERRKCMRVLKGALASKQTPFTQFHSSYIVKTAWLHVVDQNEYKNKDSWKRWEVLAIRLGDVLEKLEVSFRNKELLSKFNKNENVLARFDDPFLVSCEGYLKTLNNKLKSGAVQRFTEDLGLDGSGFRASSANKGSKEEL